MHKERIKLLIDVLENVDESRFDMSDLYQSDGPIKTVDDLRSKEVKLDAITYFCLDSRANEQGLSLEDVGKSPFGIFMAKLTIDEGVYNLEAMVRFFRLDCLVATHLFGFRQNTKLYGGKSLDEVTPKEVIAVLNRLFDEGQDKILAELKEEN